MSEGTTRAEAATHILARETGRRMRAVQARIDEVEEQRKAALDAISSRLTEHDGSEARQDGLIDGLRADLGTVQAVTSAIDAAHGETRELTAAQAQELVRIAQRLTVNEAVDARQDGTLAEVLDRVDVLEATAPVPGPKGDRGERGERGPRGLMGPPGIPGSGSGGSGSGGSGAINSVTASSGLTVTGTSDLTITNTGVRSLTGSGLTVSASTGDVTLTAPTVSGGTGISVSGSGTTSITVSATGVNSVTGGTGISVSGTTSPTVTNTGVTSLAGTGVSVSASTGAVTITAPVVSAGSGISVSGSQTTSLTITNTGVNSVSAGTGINVSGTTALTVTNTGVRSLTGSGLTVSASTGDVTLTAPTVTGGTGISVSGSGTTSLSITNSGVTSILAGTGISVSSATGAVTITSSGGSGVTAVTGTSPILSSGGATPAISFDSTVAITQSNIITGTALKASGLTGATASSRYVGATASGAPTSGTFVVGDFVIDQTGKVFVCTSGGTPGTFTAVGASASASAITRIYTTTLASDTASVDITAIPQTYTNLELIVHAAGTSFVRTVAILCIPFSGGNQSSYLVNGYAQEQFYSGSSSGTGSILNFTSDFTAGIMPGSQSNPGPAQWLFGTTKIFLANYSSATSSKGWKSEAHHSGTNNGSVNTSTLFHSAAHFSQTNSVQLGAINRLYLYPSSGNFRTGSVFTLYGWS